jgi:hypothetical protein
MAKRTQTMPGFIKPQLATLKSKAPKGEDPNTGGIVSGKLKQCALRETPPAGILRRKGWSKFLNNSCRLPTQMGTVVFGYPVAMLGTISWKVQDANCVGAWGWNYRSNAISSPNEFLTKRDKGQQGPVDIF